MRSTFLVAVDTRCKTITSQVRFQVQESLFGYAVQKQNRFPANLMIPNKVVGTISFHTHSFFGMPIESSKDDLNSNTVASVNKEEHGRSFGPRLH